MTKSKAKNNTPSTEAVPEKNIDLLIYELAQASQCEKVKPELEAQLDKLVASTPPVKVRSITTNSNSMTRNTGMNNSPAPRAPMFTTQGQEDDYTSTGSIRGGIGPRSATTLATGRKVKASTSFDAELGQLESRQGTNGTVDHSELTTGVSLDATTHHHHANYNGTSRTVVTASDRERALSRNRRIDVFSEVYADGEDNFMQDLFNAVEEKRSTVPTAARSDASELPSMRENIPHSRRHLDPISQAYDQIQNDELPPRARRPRNSNKVRPLTPKLQAKRSIESNLDLRLEEDVVAKLHGDNIKPQEEDFLATGKTAITRRYDTKPKITPPVKRSRVVRDPSKPVELPPRPKGKDIRARVEFIVGIGKHTSTDDE